MMSRKKIKFADEYIKYKDIIQDYYDEYPWHLKYLGVGSIDPYDIVGHWDLYLTGKKKDIFLLEMQIKYNEKNKIFSKHLIKKINTNLLKNKWLAHKAKAKKEGWKIADENGQ